MPTGRGVGRLTSQLRGCRSSALGSLIHATLTKSGFLASSVISNHLISCYARLGDITLAHNVFNDMLQPNVVSWTSLIVGHNERGCPQRALLMFRSMLKSSVAPSVFTLSAVVNACSVLADDKTGKQVHAYVEVFGFQSNVVVCSSLVHLYGKCNDMELSRRVFDTMGCRNIFSWTSLLAAYTQNTRESEALQIFREFNNQVDQIDHNHFMLATVINACAGLEDLSLGKSAHCTTIRFGYNFNDVVCSALVDMYAKCGNFEYAHRSFTDILNPSVVSYTSLIVAAAKCGRGAMSLKLFDEMVGQRIKPNSVTFLGLLHACSHAGLVDEGLRYFNSMHEKYGVLQLDSHYSCVLDMLSRAGRIEEAYQLVKSMKENSEQAAIVWGSLLSASRLQGRVDIAFDASKRLIELNKQVDGAYVTVSNAYALAGDWETVSNLRLQMAGSGIHKRPACSWDGI